MSNKGFAEIQTGGGADIYSICVAQSMRINLVNAYAYVNGHQNMHARGATNRLFDTIMEECDAQQGPSIICINLNADSMDVQTIRKAILNQGWVDLGAIAEKWGGVQITNRRVKQ